MLRFLVRRIAVTVPMLLLLSIGIFLMLHFAPGDAVTLLLPEDMQAQQVAQDLRHQLGLDRPLYLQYETWLLHALGGDLGYSYRSRAYVAPEIAARLPVTLELTALAMGGAVAAALPLGVAAALRRNTLADGLISALASLGLAMPAFWLGLLLILFFAVDLHWLPPAGYVPPWRDLGANLRLMILPAVTLAVPYTAVVLRIVRMSVLDVARAEYVQTARAKGLREPRVVARHILRGAFIPIITVVALETGRLLGGAVVTETIFTLPGIGRLAVDSVLSRDLPILQAATLFMALALIGANFLADVLYAWADPRLKYE
ncbi:MAG TPA: ABC transporter permease [bacterium]|nr:ABC transporter permease [bacterium]